jgi:hypothetical protein
LAMSRSVRTAASSKRCQKTRAGLYLPGANYGESTTKLLKGRKPTVDIAARLIFCQSRSLLEPAFQLITLAIDRGQIIIRDLAPLLLDLPPKLFAVTFDPIPVHDGSPIFVFRNPKCVAT